MRPRRPLDLRSQLPEAPVARMAVIASLALGGLVALGLTALILVFAWTWWRGG